MKAGNVKSSTYNIFGVENNYKSSKFEARHHLKISKQKIISAKG